MNKNNYNKLLQPSADLGVRSTLIEGNKTSMQMVRLKTAIVKIVETLESYTFEIPSETETLRVIK